MYSDDRNAFGILLCDAVKVRELRNAGGTPRAPEVNNHYLAEKAADLDGAVTAYECYFSVVAAVADLVSERDVIGAVVFGITRSLGAAGAGASTVFLIAACGILVFGFFLSAVGRQDVLFIFLFFFLFLCYAEHILDFIGQDVA